MYGIRNIIETLGYDSFYKGRNYPSNYIKHVNTYMNDSKFTHEYKVKSESTVVWYNVSITNNGYKIYDFTCECKQYHNNHTCKHIAAALLDDMENIFESEYVDEYLISKSILKNYNENKSLSVKEKLDFDFEFNIDDYITFKIYVGNKKKYLLSSETKFNNFYNAYLNKEEYVFGKNLVYDPNLYYLDETDSKLIEYISGYQKYSNYYYRTSPFILSHREFKTMVLMFNGKSFKVNDSIEINEVKNGFPTSYELKKESDIFKLDLIDFDKYKILDDECKYVVYNNTLCFLNNEESNYLLLIIKNKLKSLKFKKEDINDFSNGLFNKIKNNLVIDEGIDEVSLPVKPSVKLYFDISYSNLICNVKFDYNGNIIDYFSNTDVLRDVETEQNIIAELFRFGFYIKDEKLLIDDEDLMYDFVENILPSLSDKYEVFTSKKIDNTKILKKINTSSNFSIGQDGILSYKFDIEGIDTSELSSIFSALKSKKKYYKLKNNNVINLDENESISELNNLIEDLEIDYKSSSIEIPKYRALYIESLKNQKYKNIKTNNLFEQFIDNFKKYKNVTLNLSDKDQKILREYQMEGVKWLKTIYKCDFGGILADEMGLGKSIQTIMFIKEILKENSNSKIIIVAPTSLIYNWEKEFQKFGSELKYVVVAENKQKRKEIFENKDLYNIFITTYGLVRNDNDEYESMNFDLCVIDEAQMIKNYQAGMTKEVKKIKSKCKIALTGTPVENNVTELWSIFDFIMPGYLNSVLKFREKYNIKDVDQNGLDILKKLNYQISPFILRRKKVDVAKSLPEKIENNIYIDLPTKQKMLYVSVLNDTKKEMDEIIKTEGFSKSRMKILQLLMKLRQICIDPNVMYENYDGESIKMEELLRVVNEYVLNGHKILIFSSFKRVLERVKDIFKNNSISCYMIDGSVKSSDRMALVESFNKDNTNCFLITLKAGGTGLNLVGADVVIHLDIWWNPQVENQATDRAHRIGQTKNVHVIKLITKGTIEERIIELQEKKKILSDNLIEGNTSSENLSSLTESDIKKLLSFND